MAEVDLGIDGLEQYKLVGRGGFAAVYAAWDRRFRRWVAVKVLDALDDDGRRRFDRELGLMGQFDDEVHIVTPYRDGYTTLGSPYLVMEYLAGGSLQQLIDDDGPLPLDVAVSYVAPVAVALGRAHSGGVLHRDVKPANILLTANGVAKLTDFGIATIREATATQVAFTLAHSPPETFTTGVDDRDERSDLYSLASTLYTLVTGRPPFAPAGAQDSQLAYMRRIETNAVPPTGHDPLDAFFATALAKDPDDRYPTAAQFTTALTTTVATGARGENDTGVAPAPPDPDPDSPDPPPIDDDTTQVDNRPPNPAPDPTPPTSGSQARGWVWAVAAALAVVVIIGGLLATRDQGDDATSPTSSISDATETTSTPATEDTTASPSPRPLGLPITYTDHTTSVYSVAQLASGLVASASDDDTVQVWDPADPDTTIATYTGHTASVRAVVQLANGLVASAGLDDTVQVWDPADPETTIATYTGHTASVRAVVQLADGRVASASVDQTVQVWDPADPDTTIATYTGHTDWVLSVVQLVNGLVASGGIDGTVQVWDPVDPGTTIAIYTGHTVPVNSVVQLASGLVASASNDEMVQIWDPADPATTIATYTGHTSWVYSVVQLADGLVASASGDDTVQVWDPANPETTIATYTGHARDVLSVVQLANGLVASAGIDGTVQVWDPAGL